MKNENEIDLDYESMYKGLSQKKRDFKEQLYSVILSCTSLELLIHKLVKIKVEKLESPDMVEWAKNPNTTISKKLKALRFADLISENLYKNITLLFKIRNKFAHKLYFSAKTAVVVFEPLKEICISNDFVKKLPNNSIKFQLIASQCFAQLVEISQRWDPSSVLQLELVGDITPIEEYENDQ